MNPQAEELRRRTKQFALDVLTFVRTLPTTDQARHIGQQLTRAGTAVGANYRASCRSRSNAEFVSRIAVVLEEADESAFWLEVIIADKMSSAVKAAELLDEANQLSAICAQSRITAAKNLSLKS